MDDIVKQALAKWPNVPACWGWLGLDARGQWWLRDEQAQAQGDFVRRKGHLVVHDKLRAFIGRNYEADAQGHWYFQNGPQRVYVELENTPWVWRVNAAYDIEDQCGRSVASASRCLVDEWGAVYLVCAGAVGLVHTQDVLHVAQGLEEGRWQVQEVQRAALPEAFGFVRSPQAVAATSR